MIRSLDRYVSVEMFSLWLIEFVLVAVVTAFLFTVQPGSIYGSWELMPQVAQAAIALALTISTTSVAIGLYRPEICLQARRFLVNALVVGILAFVTIILLGMTRVVDLGLHRPGVWLQIPALEALVSWIACLLVTRGLFNAALRLELFSRRILVIGSTRSAAASRT